MCKLQIPSSYQLVPDLSLISGGDDSLNLVFTWWIDRYQGVFSLHVS